MSRLKQICNKPQLAAAVSTAMLLVSTVVVYAGDIAVPADLSYHQCNTGEQSCQSDGWYWCCPAANYSCDGVIQGDCGRYQHCGLCKPFDQGPPP